MPRFSTAAVASATRAAPVQPSTSSPCVARTLGRLTSSAPARPSSQRPLAGPAQPSTWMPVTALPPSGSATRLTSTTPQASTANARLPPADPRSIATRGIPRKIVGSTRFARIQIDPELGSRDEAVARRSRRSLRRTTRSPPRARPRPRSSRPCARRSPRAGPSPPRSAAAEPSAPRRRVPSAMATPMPPSLRGPPSPTRESLPIVIRSITSATSVETRRGAASASLVASEACGVNVGITRDAMR